jgi:DNA modification methylase
VSDGKIICGDCVEELAFVADDTFDALVTDPPYGLDFMGKGWDSSVPTGTVWSQALRTLKPGAYAVVMGSPRTYHRLAVAVEDSGFEVRDCLMWLYGSGFPKAKSCLKPAWEPILLARKPAKTATPLGIDDCRIAAADSQLAEKYASVRNAPPRNNAVYGKDSRPRSESNLEPHPQGRYPANVVHDGSDEVLEVFASFGVKVSGKAVEGGHRRNSSKTKNTFGDFDGQRNEGDVLYGDSGSAARFFYCAKASKAEKGDGNTHPTVKPLALMQWLVRLVSPVGGVVLDPFAGSGTLGAAAAAEGRKYLLIEKEADYAAIATKRLSVPTSP